MNLNRRRGFLWAAATPLMLAGAMMLADAPGARAASVPRFERQFLGVRLMTRGNTVLRKYGSPHRVLIGNDVRLGLRVIAQPRQDFLTIEVGNTGAEGTEAGSTPRGSNPYAPQGPSAPPPGINSGDAANTGEPKLTFWVYQYPKKGITNVFILDEEGRVLGIGQAGGRPGARTARGIGIGSTYSQVTRAYGFAETHRMAPTQGTRVMDLLNVSYADSHGVIFGFLNSRLRGYPNYGAGGPWCVAVLVVAAD